MARQAFEDAIAELDSVSEDSYKVRYQLILLSYAFLAAAVYDESERERELDV